MQETRQHILEILREKGKATVDEIVTLLRDRRGDSITAVTVRHHLNHLQRDNLITTPQLRHRSSPGRPQHVYALTDEAQDHFPNNYKTLAENLLLQIESKLPPEGVNVIIEGVAQTLADDANIADGPLPQRIDAAVTYLNDHGYNAHWEQEEQGYVLYTTNCPYHHVAQETKSLCGMDMRLVSKMVGSVPRLLSRVTDGSGHCAYLIPAKDEFAVD